MAHSDEAVVAALTAFRKRLLADGDDFWPFLRPFNGAPADKRAANKFLLAAIVDYQQKANRAWEQARVFVEETMGDPPDIWRAIVERHPSLEAWLNAKAQYGLHRWDNAHKRVYRIGCELIQKYDGDARRIWESGTPAEILCRLRELRVGAQISQMVLGALEDTGQTPRSADLKADVHVCRVLGRIVRGSSLLPEEATLLSRRLSPNAPWLLDRPLYVLGSGDGIDAAAGACAATSPTCDRCYDEIREICSYFAKLRQGSPPGANGSSEDVVDGAAEKSMAHDVFSQALELPVQQREELALLLWESLPHEDRPLMLDPDYEAEVLRRVEEVGSGKAKPLTLEEVIARLRKSPRLET